MSAYVCNNNGTSAPTFVNVNYTYEGLSNLFTALTADVKSLLINAADNHTASYGADKVKEFGERYYWIVYNHGKAGYDLMGRVDAGAITPKASSNYVFFKETNTDSTTLAIVVISLVSISAFGAYLFIRRRKEL